MPSNSWVVIDDLLTDVDAAGQMAADLGLVDAVAARGLPTLRLYQWARPALSLGRFQPDDDVDHAACRRLGVEVVRRPTGGRALLHGADLTYAVAMPRPPGAAGTVDAVYGWLARGLCAGLESLGVLAAVAESEGDTGPACFSSLRGSDLRVGDRKLCGSAQVHRGGVVLQHGSILLDRLPFDETAVLRYPTDDDRARAAGQLRETTITLHELGVDVPIGTVAAAIRTGFAELDRVRASTSP